MRKNNNIKRYLLPVGLAFLLSIIFCSDLSVNTGNRDNINNYQDERNLVRDHIQISKISGTIFINGTYDWVDFRNAGNCTGQGTYSDPYIIEDLVIDGGSSGEAIWIENSDVYFRIENCTLEGYIGIKLVNTSNGQLIENNCSHNEKGLEIVDSHTTIISGNTINYNEFYGIKLSSCFNITISGNIIIENGFGGISLNICHNNIILENSIFGINKSMSVPNDGMFLMESNNNTISKNTVKYHNSMGIMLSHGIGNEVSENTIINIPVGIVLSISNYSTISENYIDNSSIQGISLGDSMNNIIYRNTATNSYYYGICLRNSDYNTISRNNLAGSRILCILEENCEGNVFRNNESCDYGETDQGIPSYNIILLISSIFITLVFTFRKVSKYSKTI